jgi:class 3 adenylate cyclase
VGPESLYVKDPAAARFVAGGMAEAESLLGSPLPRLPPAEADSGRYFYGVRFDPRLRAELHSFLGALLIQIGAVAAPVRGRPEPPEKVQADYEAALGRLLRSVRSTDRRQGLLNLFWLGHTLDAATHLRELESRAPALRKAKYSLHPLLSSFYRRVDQAARREVEQADPEQWAFLAGGAENTGLVDALIEDGFAFTEVSIQDLDFNLYLSSNKRYRLSADLFFEIYSILVRETESRMRQGDRGLLSRVSRHMPGLPKSQLQTQAGIVKVMMNTHVMTYLFGDAWNTGARLTASAKLKAEAERRAPAEVLDAFLDLVAGVKRFEILSQVREAVSFVETPGGGVQQDGRGLRLYEFGDSAQVLNNAVNVTILFLDLRGFTQTSEGQISERDLTRELYTVFDEFVPLVRRFGGTVDKFLGDGIMATYGTSDADPLDPLNALRTAILCQEALRRLREEGQTYFKMGIAIHHGRAYVARFIAGETAVHTTVIGRNVNLAGRLSSAAKKHLDEDEDEARAPAPEAPRRASGLQVTVDKSGVLFNEGIAISRDTLTQLETHLALVHGEAEGGEHVMEYFDEQIGRRLLIRYAGDAKFKGVRSSSPVYEVDFEV